ncbi:uncharacterized protein LOC110836639 isoform X2 [Zootermopsis nevadensis]|uniref:uncharacterized protein LOC110836639 isoform X2 n=1 Tax=Zootermopsis nevadensis TaxID=136037 RepID=UPI000B8E21EF|nr:uncharacterized protein LOC110836639 isoform X2 [Zootermopsis nevadensis]
MAFRHVVPKVKLGELQPLPEPAEEMAVEVEEMPVPSYQESQLETHVAVNMLSALRLDGTASGNSTPSLSRDGSFDDVFGFESADDDDQGRSWQFSGDTGSSGFGNSVTSFMSWTDDVEVETTQKVQDLVDELERCFYGEESLDKLKKEVSAECVDWRSKFPHYRVRGVGLELSAFHLQRLHEKTCVHDKKMAIDEAACVVLEDDEDSEDEEEVIASHGSYQEKQELNDQCNRNCSSSPDTTEGSVMLCYGRDLSAESLQQKVKDSVMEQLFLHVWSQVSKGLEPLLHLYPDRTQQRHTNPSPMQGQSGMNTLRLPAIATSFRSFTPVSDIHNIELNGTLHVSAKSMCCSASSSLISPALESNLKVGHCQGSLRHTSVPPVVNLAKPLTFHSANHVLAPIPTLEPRGYHSAADRRTRATLNRRFSSITSGHERFLKPLEEQQTMAAKGTTNPRQVSAPASPPSWSRHVMLPPINDLNLPLKSQGLSSLYEYKTKSIEFCSRSRTSAEQKGLDSVYEPKLRNPEINQRSIMSAKQKTTLSPIESSGPISIQGTGLSKIDFTKQLLEKHEDPSFEKKDGKMSCARDRRCKQKLRGNRHVN